MNNIKAKVAYWHEYIKYYAAYPSYPLRQKFALFLLWVRKYTGKDVNFNDRIKSNLPIDVVIPTIERDLDVMTHVIDSIRDYLKHPIGEILIIGPESQKIRDICIQKGCRFIEENTVLPVRKSDINLIINGVDRSGWIFQQLLKWGADRFISNDFFLITESDTVFIRPRVFENSQKIIIPCSESRPHIPYLFAYKKLLNETIIPVFNFTSHHSLFDKKHLAMLKERIEKISGKTWYEAIIEVARLNKEEMSSVSDYETYGQFLNKHFSKEVQKEHWFNLSLRRNEIVNLQKLIAKYDKHFKAISFHNYTE